ncbi:MAG: recombinase family protein, partial [Nitrospirales bacterium]
MDSKVCDRTLGYDVKDRKLVVNPEEAERVCHIFKRYVELGSVRLLAEELEQQDIRGKSRIAPDGQSSPIAVLGRGALYRILSNRLYLGEVHHQSNYYRGEHEAIVGRELWNEVARLLADNRNDRKYGTNAEEPSLLAGMIFDETGQPLTPTHATKGGRRYRYYVSKSLITG